MQPTQDNATPQLLRQGQNSHVELCDGQTIIKYPKNSSGNQALLQEAEILRRLQDLLPLDIPRPLEGPGLRYERLEGEELSREALQALPQAHQDSAAAQLGNFLRTLHGLPTSLLDGLTLPSADTARHWRDFYQKISTMLFPHFRADAVEPVRWRFVRHLNRRSNFNVTPVVLHGDFGPTNLLYDDAAYAVRVIDFGSVRLGDPAADIAALMGPFGYGEGFVAALAPHYPGLNRLMERARFYAQTFALQQALWGLEHGEREVYEDAMKKYI